MNIFASSADPETSAHNLDDIRVNKMMLESAQMLSMAVAFRLNSSETRISKRGFEYKSYTNQKCPELMKPHPMHIHHPCTKWARESKGNYEWLLEHLKALNSLYKFTSGKTHATKARIKHLESYIVEIPTGPLQPFRNSARCQIGSFQHVKDTNLAYQMYLSAKWDTDVIRVSWKKRNHPKWYEDFSWNWLDTAKNVSKNIEFRADSWFVQEFPNVF